jgi:hypothetical protein
MALWSLLFTLVASDVAEGLASPAECPDGFTAHVPARPAGAGRVFAGHPPVATDNARWRQPTTGLDVDGELRLVRAAV